MDLTILPGLEPPRSVAIRYRALRHLRDCVLLPKRRCNGEGWWRHAAGGFGAANLPRRGLG
jgi:hypothetical protein